MIDTSIYIDKAIEKYFDGEDVKTQARLILDQYVSSWINFARKRHGNKIDQSKEIVELVINDMAYCLSLANSIPEWFDLMRKRIVGELDEEI